MIREVESHWQETAELGIEAGLCLRTGTLTTALRDTTEGRGLKTPPPPTVVVHTGRGENPRREQSESRRPRTTQRPEVGSRQVLVSTEEAVALTL